MKFEDEIGAAFAEVSDRGMPVHFKLTNAKHTGVAQTLGSAEHLREAGYETEGAIVIASPISQYSRPPDEQTRERLEVLIGSLRGIYSVVKVNADAAHYSLTAIPVEE